MANVWYPGLGGGLNILTTIHFEFAQRAGRKDARVAEGLARIAHFIFETDQQPLFAGSIPVEASRMHRSPNGRAIRLVNIE